MDLAVRSPSSAGAAGSAEGAALAPEPGVPDGEVGSAVEFGLPDAGATFSGESRDPARERGGGARMPAALGVVWGSPRPDGALADDGEEMLPWGGVMW